MCWHSPAWKSIPTASDVPETGTRASDLSAGSSGIPLMPSWTEYRRNEPTPKTNTTTITITAKCLFYSSTGLCIFLFLVSECLRTQEHCAILQFGTPHIYCIKVNCKKLKMWIKRKKFHRTNESYSKLKKLKQMYTTWKILYYK